MPNRKGKNKSSEQDFTINDFANASKPINRLKKNSNTDTPEIEDSWEQIEEGDYDIIEETNSDGTKSFVYKRRRNRSKLNSTRIEDRPGIVYPEIVWYLISRYIKPEQVGTFAIINKSTYAITKRESFWRTLYKRHCADHPKLPEKLHLEYSYKLYGLRQRVIRALYHTYDIFVKKVAHQALHDSQPHQLVKRRCVNVWYCKGATHWSVFFKFKKLCPFQYIDTDISDNLIDELGRIDANPEEDSQVLQVTCQGFHEVPPLMGMTLSSVSILLSQGFRYHRLHLGFTSSQHNISRNILPECTVVIDTVVNILVFDWWHPKYPHFDNRIPLKVRLEDEEKVPVLKKDFFMLYNHNL